MAKPDLETLKDKLDDLEDSFKDWKNIYGESVPDGYMESKNQELTRKTYVRQIEALRQQIKGLK